MVANKISVWCRYIDAPGLNQHLLSVQLLKQASAESAIKTGIDAITSHWTWTKLGHRGTVGFVSFVRALRAEAGPNHTSNRRWHKPVSTQFSRWPCRATQLPTQKRPPQAPIHSTIHAVARQVSIDTCRHYFQDQVPRLTQRYSDATQLPYQ